MTAASPCSRRQTEYLSDAKSSNGYADCCAGSLMLRVPAGAGEVRFEGNSDGRAMLAWVVGTFALLRSRGGISCATARLRSPAPLQRCDCRYFACRTSI